MGTKKQEPDGIGGKGLFDVVYHDRLDTVGIRLTVIVCFIDIDFLADGEAIDGPAVDGDFGQLCRLIAVNEVESDAVAHGAGDVKNEALGAVDRGDFALEAVGLDGDGLFREGGDIFIIELFVEILCAWL